jgi:NADH-quinone oxidoreductase subunit L
VVAIGGILVAYFFYRVRPAIPQNLARSMRGLYVMLINKYWVDELYDLVFVQTGINLAKGLANGVDKLLIDNILVDGTAKAVAQLGRLLSKLQSGYASNYALATFIGVLILISYFFLR